MGFDIVITISFILFSLTGMTLYFRTEPNAFKTNNYAMKINSTDKYGS